MVSEQAKTAIDGLSKDELRVEVNKAYRSRFQGDNYAYARGRLEQLEEEQEAKYVQAQLDVAAEANKIAKEAIGVANRSWRMAALSALVAIVAIVVAMCSKG